MQSVEITAVHARAHQARMLADAENRRLVRQVRPHRAPLRVNRRFADLLVRVARRLDPSVLRRIRTAVS